MRVPSRWNMYMYSRPVRPPPPLAAATARSKHAKPAALCSCAMARTHTNTRARTHQSLVGRERGLVADLPADAVVRPLSGATRAAARRRRRLRTRGRFPFAAAFRAILLRLLPNRLDSTLEGGLAVRVHRSLCCGHLGPLLVRRHLQLAPRSLQRATTWVTCVAHARATGHAASLPRVQDLARHTRAEQHHVARTGSDGAGAAAGASAAAGAAAASSSGGKGGGDPSGSGGRGKGGGRGSSQVATPVAGWAK